MASLRVVPAGLEPRRRAASRLAGSLSTSAAAGAPDDDDRHLAAHPVARPTRRGRRARPRRTSSWVLVSSRHTAARRSAPNASAIAASAAAVRCGASKNTMRALLGGQRGQPAGPLARLAGQEPLEAEPVDRQPGHRQRGEHRRRPGHGGDRDAGSTAAATSR